VLCCIAVGGTPLFHCAWYVVRVGVLCCIVIGGDPRTLLLRSAPPHRCALNCSRGRHPHFLSLSFSMLFAHLPKRCDMHEATHQVAILNNPPACGASRLRRLEFSRIVLLFWGAWPKASSAGARPVKRPMPRNKRCFLVRMHTLERSWPRTMPEATSTGARPGALRSWTRGWLRLYGQPSVFLSRRWRLPPPHPPLFAALGLSCRGLATAGNEAIDRWGLPELALQAARYRVQRNAC
jgi:hypothetical protein